MVLCIATSCVCLTRWDTICVSCHNGIVHSHQLCFAESAFTYTFKDFLLSAMHVVFDSCSEIGLLQFSWLVEFVASFGELCLEKHKIWGEFGDKELINLYVFSFRPQIICWNIVIEFLPDIWLSFTIKNITFYCQGFFCLLDVLAPIHSRSSCAASTVKASMLAVSNGAALGSSCRMVLSSLKLSFFEYKLIISSCLRKI